MMRARCPVWRMRSDGSRQPTQHRVLFLYSEIKLFCYADAVAHLALTCIPKQMRYNIYIIKYRLPDPIRPNAARSEVTCVLAAGLLAPGTIET